MPGDRDEQLSFHSPEGLLGVEFEAIHMFLLYQFIKNRVERILYFIAYSKAYHYTLKT